VNYYRGKIRTKVAFVLTGIFVTAALVLPAAAFAKTYHVSLTNVSHSGEASTLKGTVKGSPLGNCTYTGKLTIPNTTQVWTCTGGKIYVTSHGTSGVSNNATGTWTVTKGTGKYGQIKGGGKLTGKLSTGTYKYAGTLKF